MSNKKTSDELSGSPIEGADLFRIARGTDNYKLTSDEVFSETLTKLEATNKMAANELIVGRVYKITTPSTAFPAISFVYLTAVATNKFSPEATVTMVDGKNYEAFYDFSLDTFGYVNVTHAVLRNLGMNSQLVPGITYRITDYKSVNFVNGFLQFYNDISYTNGDYNNQELYVSPVEVLRVKAISESQLERTAFSESFPQDILEYDVYGNSACQYLELYNGQTLPNSSTVSNFDLQWDAVNSQVYIDMPTGYPVEFNQELYIYWNAGPSYKEFQYYPYYPNLSTLPYRDSSDTPVFPTIKIVNNGTRIVFEGLTYTDYNNYDANTLEVDHVYKFANSYGHVLRRVDTRLDIDMPVDFRNYKYRRYSTDVFKNYSGPNILLATSYIHSDNVGANNGFRYCGYNNKLEYDFSDSILVPIFSTDLALSQIKGSRTYSFSILDSFYDFDNVVFIQSLSFDYIQSLNFSGTTSTISNTSIFDSKFNIYKSYILNSDITILKMSNYSVNDYDIYFSLIYGANLQTIYNLLRLDWCSIYSSCGGLEFNNNFLNRVEFNVTVTTVTFDTYLDNLQFTVGAIMGLVYTKTIFRANNNVPYLSYFDATGPAMVYSTTINC